MAGKDYAKIAASKIRRPSQSSRKPRILVYGRNKKGKTRFAASAPDVLILDPESGTEGLTKTNPNVWPVDSWQEFDDAYQFLKLDKHPYKWVCVDGLTRFSNMSLRFVMGMEEERDLSRKPGMVQKQDYGKSGELLKGMLWNFHSLNMGVIYTAQERAMEIEDDPDTEDGDAEAVSMMYVPDLPKGARSAVNSIVDVIGRIYTVRLDHPQKEDVKVVQRRLWLAPHVAYDTGYRSDYTLPDYLKGPTVPKLVQLLREGKVTRNAN
jgi:hypothetical protein